MAAKRTTHRSSSGKKLYAVRDSKGQFKDIQSYARAHGQDIKKTSASERKSKLKGPARGPFLSTEPTERP